MPRRLLPEERAVVLGEVRSRVGPGDAGEQPRGEDAEVAAAEVAATPHGLEHRLARGLDPLLPGDLREHRHAPRRRRPVEPVQVLDHPGGQRRAHAGLAPGPGPPAKEPELRHGVDVDRDAPAEPPAVPGDELARPLAGDRHLVGAEADRDVGARELGPGAVGVGAHGGLAPLVARSHEPGHAGERPGGQGAEGGAVRLEELAPRPSLLQCPLSPKPSATPRRDSSCSRRSPTRGTGTNASGRTKATLRSTRPFSCPASGSRNLAPKP